MAFTAFLKYSVGKKALMAVTGFVLLGFVLGHLAGNLLIFLGPDALNAYAKKLVDLGPLLWVARGILLAAVIAHIVLAIQLAQENRAARPEEYHYKASRESTLPGRTMMISGGLVAAFILYHLLHFTFRVTHPDISNLHDAAGRHDVYAMVVLSFQSPIVAAVYIVAMFFLCAHLSHGMASMIQSLGLQNEECRPLARKISCLISLAIFIGYISIPVCIWLGMIKMAGGTA